MRLVLFLALLLVVLATVSLGDGTHSRSLSHASLKRVERVKEPKKKEEDAGEEESAEEVKPMPSHKKGKKPKPEEEVQEDDEAIDICDGSEEQACECLDLEKGEVHCVSVLFDPEGSSKIPKLLDTLDVTIDPKTIKKGFSPVQAFFMNNAITVLRKGHMPEEMAETLEALDVGYNHISKIEKGALKPFNKLKRLILKNNRLKAVTSSMWEGLGDSLHVLDLSHNDLTSLGKKPFSNLKNLKKLSLDENDIELDSTTFDGLENLEELSMDSCNLKKIPIGILEGLKKLRGLSIRRNNFSDIPDGLKDVPDLTDLDMSETTITEIHKKSFDFESNLTNLFLENMPLLNTIEDCAFCGLQNLTKISLNNSTKLTKMDENAFGYKADKDNKTVSVKTFWLANTKVDELGADLLAWNKLEEFNGANIPLNCLCEHENLAAISETTDSPVCATPVHLKGRQLYSIPSGEICPPILLGVPYTLNGRPSSFRSVVVFGSLLCCVFAFLVYKFNLHKKAAKCIHLPTIPGVTNGPMRYSNLSDDHDEREILPRGNGETPDFVPREHV